MWKPIQKKAPLREKQAKRLSPKEYADYQDYIKDIGVCQVCEESTDLDTPHHSLYGLGVKSDISLVCICINCHSNIHSKGYGHVPKTRKEIESIGKHNWRGYQCE